MESSLRSQANIQFRFIHAADLHLDSPLRGLARYEGAPVERLRLATRRAAEKLVDLAIAEDVAFVVIAGDVFDGDWPDYNTGLFFVQQLVRLREAGIRVFLIRGNHDAASQVTKSLRLPDNVVLFGTEKATSFNDPDLPVVVHGHSFASQAVKENLAQGYPAAVEGLFNLGVLHTSATGREGHETYAPCTIDDLLRLRYDYWALGHIHQREILHESPPIVFSGNIQGRHIRETGPKGCYLVSVRHDRSIAPLQFQPLDVARWLRLTVDISGTREAEQILECVAEALRDVVNQADGRLQCVRVALTGQTDWRADLVSRHEDWTNEIRSVAMQISRDAVWIEKVDFTSLVALSPTPDSRAAIHESDLAGPWSVLESVWDEWKSSPALVGQAGFSMSDVLRQLPDEVARELASDDDPLFLELLDEARLRLKAMLFEEGKRS